MKSLVLPRIFKPFYCPDLIRLGKENDGGYLVNVIDVKKTSRLLSFGIGSDISFEEDFIKINDCKIDAYDGTIEKIPEFFKDNKVFHTTNIEYNFHEYVYLDQNNIFLKCDIEDSEYLILDALIRKSKNFSGIVIEFHKVHDYARFNLLTNFIAKTHLKLIHVHANNNSYIETNDRFIPDCLELTFTSSDNIMYTDIELPHNLDMPNTSQRNELNIVFE